MKWYSENPIQITIRKMKWHKWYAWHPVRINNHFVWLEMVERKIEIGRFYREIE